MFQRVQLTKLVLHFAPACLAGPLRAYLKSVRSEQVGGGRLWDA